jgi:hypothetical protein
MYGMRLPIQPNLELKTWPKQLLGSLQLDIAQPEPIILSGIYGAPLECAQTLKCK